MTIKGSFGFTGANDEIEKDRHELSEVKEPVKITVLYGYKELKPIDYWIEEVHSDVTKWWHWKKPRFKSEYYLVNEFMRLGPFENEEIIYRYSGMAGMIIGTKPLAMVVNALSQT